MGNSPTVDEKADKTELSMPTGGEIHPTCRNASEIIFMRELNAAIAIAADVNNPDITAGQRRAAQEYIDWHELCNTSRAKIVRKMKDEVKRPANLAVFGKAGTGKSSFINTSSAAMSGVFDRSAAEGNGVGNKTNDVQAYFHRYNPYSRQATRSLINIFDVPGRPDADESTLIWSLINGYYGAGAGDPKKHTHWLPCETYFLDAVIFVAKASSDDDVERLAASVGKGVSAANRQRASMSIDIKRKCPVRMIVVMTANDLVIADATYARLTPEEAAGKVSQTECNQWCDRLAAALQINREEIFHVENYRSGEEMKNTYERVNLQHLAILESFVQGIAA